MKKRSLGKSGLRVSEIGLGCWQFGGDFGPIDDQQSVDTLLAAKNAGVTFLDTADVYGAGRSEQVVGQHHEEGTTIVATKVGRSAELFPDQYDLEEVRKHVLASKERLGVEQIDLIQLHCVPLAELKKGEVFSTMNRLRDEGLVAHWGASVETLEEAEICLQQDGLTSLQIIFNVFRQDAAWELFPAAQAANVGIITRLPLASGMLSGKFGPGQQFAESDHRNYNADGAAFSVGETFSGIPFATGLRLVDELRSFVPAGMSLAEFSLRWILDFPAVSSVIAGCSKPSQVISNAATSAIAPLPTELHEQLKDFYLNEVRQHIRCPL